MSSAWTALMFSDDRALEELAAADSHVVETWARARIETARSEFRQGRVEEGGDILSRMVERLRPKEDVEQGADLVIAIACSVFGQGMEQVGSAEVADGWFRQSVETFDRVDVTALNPRDRSDYGIALDACGQEDGGLTELVRSRAEGGATPEAARHHAAILLRAGETEVAEALLKEALLSTPTDPDALRALGMIQHRSGQPSTGATLLSTVYALMVRRRYDEAIEVLDLFASLTMDQTPLAGVRAEALRLANRPEEALEWYDRAARAHTSTVWSAAASSALLALGRLDEAADRMAEAMRASPDDVSLLVLAGDIALGRERWAEASDLGDRITQSAPGNPAGHHLVARAERERGDRAKALGAIRDARLLAPADAAIRWLHAVLEQEEGSAETAIEIYRQICAEQSSSPEAHARLTRLLVTVGDVDAAATVALTALNRFGDTEDVLLAIGDILRQEGNPAAAVDYLQRAVALPEHTVASTVALARNLASDGRSEEALAVCAQAREEAPGASLPDVVSAQVLADTDRWSEAMSMAQGVLERSPDEVDALVVVGRVRLAMEDNATAQEPLRRALRLEPTHVYAKAYLAAALLDSDPGEAHALLDRLIDQDGFRSSWARRSRGRLLLDQDDVPAAVSDFEEAVSLDPTDGMALANLAEGRRLVGDLEAALETADRAIDLDPSGFALVVRAMTYRALDRLDEARDDLERAVQLAPDYGYPHVVLAQLAQLTHDPARALEHLERARLINPDDREVRVEQAALDFQQGRYVEAADAYAGLVAGGADGSMWASYVDALRLAGKPDDAVQAARLALVDDPTNQSVRRSLAITYVDQGKQADGVRILSELDRDAPDATTRSDLAWALASDNQPERALALYDEALRLAPDDTWTLSAAVRLLIEIGDYPRAEVLARRACAIDSTNLDVLGWLGWALQYREDRDLAGAEQAFDTAWQQMPEDDKDPWVLSGRGDCRHLRGDGRARADFEESLKMAEAHPSQTAWTMSVAGWCRFRLGDLSGAARAFLEQTSLGGSPGSEAFDLALVTMCRGRSTRAAKQYADALRVLDAKDPLFLRGMVSVAVVDLRDAFADGSADAADPAAEEVLRELMETLDRLPDPPALPFVDSLSVGSLSAGPQSVGPQRVGSERN